MDDFLRKETSCFNNLRWRVYIDNDVSLEYFIKQLSSIGYCEKNHPLFPKIVEMKHETGHGIIFVPKTNRIQIKLDIESDEDSRIQNAKDIALKLVKILHSTDE
jgi:hypothetical protein